MKCTKCDNPLEIGAKYCPKCGTEVKAKKRLDAWSIVTIIAVVTAINLFPLINRKSKEVDLSPSAITKLVDDIKSKTALPMKADANTTVTDITPIPEGIQYHYLIEGLDFTGVTNESLKSQVLPNICGSSDIKNNLLENGIKVQYSYTIKEIKKEFLITFTNLDCP